jgi:uncharacterized protein
MDLVLALALGLLGSLHCAAMCGPLMLALPVTAAGSYRFIAGRMIYQAGRMVTYVLLGLAAGLVGKSVFMIGMQRWVSIGLGVAILGGWFVSKRVAVSAPVIRGVAVLKRAMSTQLQRRGLRSLAVLGMLNGLLPCGLVYAALASAVTQGTIWSAAGFMAVFGVGTLPMMLGLSLAGRMLSPAWRGRLNRLIPVGIGLLAVLLILRGLSLGIPYLSPDLETQAGCCGF